MDATFHKQNRERLFQMLPEGALAVLFSGIAPRQSADAYYPFYASRNYLYLAGVDFEGCVLTLQKQGGACREVLYIPPNDAHAERWTGRRYTPDEARALSAVGDIRRTGEFRADFEKALQSGEAETVWLDLFKLQPSEPDDEAHQLAAALAAKQPAVKTENLLPLLRELRTLKAPCEVDAMRKAMAVTRAGILAMMKASRPGMYEYEYKAEFDYALTKHGVLRPAFPPIISAGGNNFCIHYYSYTGRAENGDMVLNDVGAAWDNEANDVSRGWPVNGKFSKDQAALYTAAYHTSNHLFSIIKPGMPMEAVDETARRFCFEELKKIGLLSSYDDIGKYMWHGGAHHVGYDTHDVVREPVGPIAPNMVFCVDVGIYCEEWGIGFRLEDNCLVTPGGCENLSASVPRSIADIEAFMAQK